MRVVNFSSVCHIFVNSLGHRGHSLLNRPQSLFDPHETIALPESLVRLASTQAHDTAEEYSATLDEVRARQASLESGHLQRLMLGLVGDPLTKWPKR